MFFIVFWWRFHWKIALTLRLWDGFCWFLCLNARARSKIAIVEIIPGYPVVETAIHSKKRCHFDLCILCFLAVAPNDNPNDTRTIAAQVMLCAMLEKEPWGVGEDLPQKCRWPFCSDGFEFWVIDFLFVSPPLFQLIRRLKRVRKSSNPSQSHCVQGCAAV